MYLKLFETLENKFKLNLISLNSNEIGIPAGNLKTNEKATVINYITTYAAANELKISVLLLDNDIIIKHF